MPREGGKETKTVDRRRQQRSIAVGAGDYKTNYEIFIMVGANKGKRQMLSDA